MVPELLTKVTKCCSDVMMRFIHFSVGPCLGVPADANQYSRMTDHGAKPDGLWFCADENDGWEAFVRRKVREGNTSFSLGQIKYRTGIEFYATSNVLFVRNGEDFDRFAKNYGQISEQTLERTRSVFRRSPLIDWPRLAREFDALVISPFRSDCLQYPKSEWYRCWDVASGCVWNPKAVILSALNY
jgi:hypothetical protein